MAMNLSIDPELIDRVLALSSEKTKMDVERLVGRSRFAEKYNFLFHGYQKYRFTLTGQLERLCKHFASTDDDAQ